MSLRNDPCATLSLTRCVGGYWSDRHGIFKRYSTVGIKRQDAHTRDCTADWTVSQHHQEIPAGGDSGAEFPDAKRPSKLDPFAEKLSGWLVMELRKSRKDRRTAKHMHADLVQLGFDGSYERVAVFVRGWKADRQLAQQTTGRGTFVPLVFQAGEAFQFDWSEDWAVIGGERVKLQVAHIKLSHSRAFLVRAYLLQTHEMLFDAHWHAFRVFDGIPSRGIYDNMKTAVDRVGRGKQRDINARFLAMTSHYLFEPEFCNPAAGWEKGQVEKNVRDARHRLWHVAPTFPDLEALNNWLEDRCKVLWAETAHGTLPGSIGDAWEAEKAALMPLPTAFDGFVELSKRVSPTCLITLIATVTLCQRALRTALSAYTSTPSGWSSWPKGP